VTDATATTATTTTGQRPAAWHADPSGRHQLRWWDGRAWTNQVSDQGEISIDAPVRRPAGEAEPESEPEPEPQPEAESEPEPQPEAEAVEEQEHLDLESLDPLAPAKKPPPELRASTAPSAGDDDTPMWRRLLLPGVGLVLVLGSLFWGWHNWSSANEWRDRANTLDAQIDTRLSNNDALERSISNAASRGARLQDGQQVLVAFRDATNATVEQLYACANALDAMLVEAARGGDPNSVIDRAQHACGTAVGNAEVLQGILEEITG
jgi:Protein of unknown function (DUF2510)